MGAVTQPRTATPVKARILLKTPTGFSLAILAYTVIIA